MKKIYTSPELVNAILGAADVITTSGIKFPEPDADLGNDQFDD